MSLEFYAGIDNFKVDAKETSRLQKSWLDQVC